MILSADEVFVSAASIWEISTKAALGKIEADVDALVAEINAAGFRESPVTAAHAAAVRALPDIHRDPFDRIVVAQALTEPLRLMTGMTTWRGTPIWSSRFRKEGYTNRGGPVSFI